MASTEPESENFVQSFAKGLAVLRSFKGDHAGFTLSEISRNAGISRASARRLLLTLEILGYVRSTQGSFALTPLVLEFGNLYLESIGLPEIAQPHLEILSAKLGESTSAAVLDSGEIVYVARVSTKKIMSANISVGTKFPAALTAMGRVQLATKTPQEIEFSLDYIKNQRSKADLERIRESIYSAADSCIVDQELEAGLRSIAVPIHDATGVVIAAINISANALQTDISTMKNNYLPELIKTAAVIEKDIARVSRRKD